MKNHVLWNKDLSDFFSAFTMSIYFLLNHEQKKKCPNSHLLKWILMRILMHSFLMQMQKRWYRTKCSNNCCEQGTWRKKPSAALQRKVPSVLQGWAEPPTAFLPQTHLCFLTGNVQFNMEDVRHAFWPVLKIRLMEEEAAVWAIHSDPTITAIATKCFTEDKWIFNGT